MADHCLGLDFGTTNSVLSMSDGAGSVRLATYSFADSPTTSFRSALTFWEDYVGDELTTNVEAGPWAIRQFVDFPTDSRFLQSFKTFAASQSFTNTSVYGNRYTFEDLLARFVGLMMSHLDDGVINTSQPLVIGRPVEFAGRSADEALALKRYEGAFRALGFADVAFVLEPVAAAYFFAQRLETDATILVGDFGGGTSDFSVIRFTQCDGVSDATAVSHAGLGLAGDKFDYRIIDNLVLPMLGKGTQYTSWGKILDIPSFYFNNFARWNDMFMLGSAETLRELRQIRRTAQQPELIENFLELIEDGINFQFFEAVSNLKAELSTQNAARLQTRLGTVEIDETVDRQMFESWIAPDLLRIGTTVDLALEKAALRPDEIDRVFLTGGTSFVPAVQDIFSDKFGRDKISTGDELTSVATGLSLIGDACA